MKSWFVHIGSFLVVVAIAGLVMMVSGAIPIKASSQHWPITKWLLTFSMSRSVSTQSLGITAPATLDDRAMITRGAGHFETGCAPCHGSPIWQQPRIAQWLMPTPPQLSEKVDEWAHQELFSIVKHGVKFTGMPAFPAQNRDDEVWAVVAFLNELETLDEDGYRELVFGSELQSSSDAPHDVIEHCARCHGLDGRGRDTSAFPKITHLHPEYFIATMQAYASGKRHSGMMEPIASRLNEQQIRDIADYYCNQALIEASPQASLADEDAVERGKAIAIDGIPDQDVGACNACHLRERSDHNPNYPALTGQFADYLLLQLELFQSRHRGGAQADLMHAIADGLKADQMRDVAAYYASLEVTPVGSE